MKVPVVLPEKLQTCTLVHGRHDEINVKNYRHDRATRRRYCMDSNRNKSRKASALDEGGMLNCSEQTCHTRPGTESYASGEGKR